MDIIYFLEQISERTYFQNCLSLNHLPSKLEQAILKNDTNFIKNSFNPQIIANEIGVVQL